MDGLARRAATETQRGLETLLANLTGALHADGYAGFNSLYEINPRSVVVAHQPVSEVRQRPAGEQPETHDDHRAGANSRRAA